MAAGMETDQGSAHRRSWQRQRSGFAQGSILAAGLIPFLSRRTEYT
jgi:hypothetical protein